MAARQTRARGPRPARARPTGHPPATAPRHSAALASFPSGERAPAAARAQIAGWLEGSVSDAVMDDALLVVSELVTNGVRHAGTVPGSPLRVAARLTDRFLRLEVGDAGATGAVVQRTPGEARTGGFGINVVDAVAAHWGVAHAGGGTQVWCELALGDRPGGSGTLHGMTDEPSRAAAGLHRTIPALPVRDVPAAVTHYRDRFGFTPAHESPDFAVIGRDDAVLHLWAASDDSWTARGASARPVRSGAESFLAGTASCRIEVADVDALFAELEAAGVLHPTSRGGVADTDFGTREFATLDRDGNLLSFFRWVA